MKCFIDSKFSPQFVAKNSRFCIRETAMFDKVIALSRLTNAKFLWMSRKDVCETQSERRSEIVNWYNRKENRNRSRHEILTRTVGIL